MDQNLKEKGLLPKYIIAKTDGSPVDKEAKYFVLRYDNYGSDSIHTKACRKALRTYANNIKNHLPRLAYELYAVLSQYDE